MRKPIAAAFAVAIALAAGSSAVAGGEPTAIVEDVASAGAGVEFMDYVSAGQIIRLGAADRIVLGYLSSCTREEIAGGTVTVGARESMVEGGRVRRETTPCAGGALQLTPKQADKGAVIVFRKPVNQGSGALAVLYGASPLIETGGGGTLVIERLDAPGDRIEVELSGKRLLRGGFYDFAKDDRALVPGGRYRAELSGRQVEFEVDSFAKPGRGPLVGRLLRFPLD